MRIGFLAHCRIAACLAVLFLFSPLMLFAQFNSGLEGTVVDTTGAVVPNATLTLLNLTQGTSQSQVSSGAGYYHFDSLPAGSYRLTVSAKGFQTVVQNGINLSVSQITTVNVKLNVGAVTQQITVTSAPPVIQTAQPSVSGLVSQSQISQMPMVGRNPINLVSIAPGITGLPSTAGQISAQASGDVFQGDLFVGMNANGLRSEQNGFAVDGGDVTSMTRGGVDNFDPSADSVQEFRVSVNSFDPAYMGAGAHVDVITKSGTNQFHGNADWFTTNQDLQARNEFEAGVPNFSRNEFSGDLGGPIIRNRSFFFASIDKLFSTVPAAVPTVIQTPQFISWMQQNLPNNLSTKLFTTYPSAIKSFNSVQTAQQVAGAPCAANGTVSTAAGNIPCGLPVLGSAVFNIAIPRNGLQWGARFTQQFPNQKDRFDAAVYRTSVDNADLSPNAYYPNFAFPQLEVTYNAHLNETHTFSPSLLNDARYSFVRLWGSLPCAQCAVPLVPNVGNGVTGIGGGGPIIYIQNNFQVHDDMMWNHGSHAVKFGFDWLRTESNYFPNYSYTRPSFTFANVFSFAADTPVEETGFTFNPVTGAQTFPAVAERQPYWEFYGGDTWTLRKNLTFTYGLRWETFGKVREATEVTNFVLPPGNNLFTRIADARVAIVPSILTKLRYGNFGPRIGLTWDPMNNGRMSIRAGFGRYYDPYTSQVYGGSHYNPPIAASGTASIFVPSGPQPLFALGTSNTFPFGIPYPKGIQLGLNSHGGLANVAAAVTGTDPELKTAYTQSWLLGVQFALGANWIVETDYLGSEGHHFYQLYDVNRFAGDLIKNNAVVTRYNLYFGRMSYAQSNGNTNYTGGLVVVKTPSFRGLNMTVSYDIGKAIDEQSSFSENQVENAADPGAERARSDYDARHKVAAGIVWHLPGAHLSSALARNVIGGWQLSDVTILQSGTPLTVYTSAPFQPVFSSTGQVIGNKGGDYNADGNNYDRPNTPSFGNVNRGSSRSDYFKGLFTQSEFPVPALGQEGNLGRNTYHGPGYANSNLTLAKHIATPWFGADKADTEVRLESYNIFNRVNAGGV